MTPETDGPLLRFFQPAPALRELVSTYYLIGARAAGVDDWLHPEWGNARIALEPGWEWGLAGRVREPLPDATLFGPTSRAANIFGQPGSLAFGVGLLPLGWAVLVGTPANAMADRAAALADFWPEADVVRAALTGAGSDAELVAHVDVALLARLSQAPASDPVLARAHRALMEGDISTVPAFAAGAGLGGRTLGRLSGRLFGFAPKPLLRRQRFLRALDQIMRGGLPSLTAVSSAEYADQAHFTREFRAFMGMSPTAYMALPRKLLKLAAAERMKAFGETLQGLHRPPG
jgi:AraC-like DNA-binding protein